MRAFVDSGTQEKGHGLHYGYVIVLSLFVAQMLIFFGNRSIGIVLLDIQETLGITISQVGVISALFVGINNFGSLIWGGIADRIGPRICMLISGMIFSLACFLFGLLGGTAYPLALILWAFAGFGSSGLQESVIPKLINSWFSPKKRGHAMRLAMPGGPCASLLLGAIMPIGVSLWGWGPVFVIIGIVSFLLTMVFLLVRNTPAEKGLLPVGRTCAEEATRSDENSRSSETLPTKERYRRALKMKEVWIIGILACCYEFYFYCNSTYYVSNVRSMGYTTAEAGLMVTIMALVAVAAMQFWGPFSDRVGRKKSFMICLAGAIIMPIVIYFVSETQPSLFTMYLMIALLTFFLGQAPVFYSLFADYFPQEINSTCSGIVSALSALGSYLGPFLGGLIIDCTGSMYSYNLLVTGGALLCFLVASLLPKQSFED